MATNKSCAALIDEGLGYAKAGNGEAAISCFERVITACAVQTEPWMAAMMAAGLFNKATVYRFASDTDKAVAVFDEIVSRFGDAEEITLERHVCKALYNKGVALQDAKQWTTAIDAFSVVVSRWPLATDELIRERVARSLWGKTQCYNGLEQPEEATRVVEELVMRFGGAAEAGIQVLIGPSILAVPRLLSRLPPAGHALMSPYNLAMEEDLKQELANEPELLKSYMDTHRSLIAGDVARAAERHRQAVAVLEEYWERGTPFALYLRNFDLEASEKEIAVGEGMVVPISMTTGAYSDVERTVEGMLEKRIRAIGISNPASFRPDVTQLIPKLELRNEVWEYALHILVSHAALIVMKMEHLTPGVTVEVNAISTRKRGDAAVVILPEEVQAPAKQFEGFALAVTERELESPAIKTRLQGLITKALG